MDVPALAMRLPGLATPGIGSTPAMPATPSVSPAGNAIGGFGQALTNAISGLNASQNQADDMSVKMAAGEPIDLHEVMLARETASLHFQLAVQVRNKLVEAYQDVMRMQV
ncbi:MAG: flagellar hook-basal body complex protein FliE [Chloroflexota bacterium]